MLCLCVPLLDEIFLLTGLWHSNERKFVCIFFGNLLLVSWPPKSLKASSLCGVSACCWYRVYHPVDSAVLGDISFARLDLAQPRVDKERCQRGSPVCVVRSEVRKIHGYRCRCV